MLAQFRTIRPGSFLVFCLFLMASGCVQFNVGDTAVEDTASTDSGSGEETAEEVEQDVDDDTSVPEEFLLSSSMVIGTDSLVTQLTTTSYQIGPISAGRMHSFFFLSETNELKETEKMSGDDALFVSDSAIHVDLSFMTADGTVSGEFMVGDDTLITLEIVYEGSQFTLLNSTPVVSASGGISSSFPAMSDDGNIIVFEAEGVAGSSKTQILAKKFSTGEIFLVSSPDGEVAADSTAFFPVISGDGRYVYFMSDADNLDPLFPNLSNFSIFRKDLSNVGTAPNLVSKTDASTAMSLGYTSTGPNWSTNTDGSLLVFVGTNAAITGQNGWDQVLLKDVAGGLNSVPTIISKLNNGTASSTGSRSPSINGAGTKIAFTSTSTNLSSGNSTEHVYVQDYPVVADSVLISRLGNGTLADGDSWNPKIISSTGKVLFLTSANNLGYGGYTLYINDPANLATNPVHIVCDLNCILNDLNNCV